MKSIALNQVNGSNFQFGLWNTVRKFFQVQELARESAKSMDLPHTSQDDLAFFSHEYELEDYIRSFRE